MVAPCLLCARVLLRLLEQRGSAWGIYSSLWPSCTCHQPCAWLFITTLPTATTACPGVTGAGGAAGCSPHPRWCLLQTLQPLATVQGMLGWHSQSKRSAGL